VTWNWVFSGWSVASAGALWALSMLTEVDESESAVALVSPATRLASIVAAKERRFEVIYQWNEGSRAMAGRLDFVARADEVAACDVPLFWSVLAMMQKASARLLKSCAGCSSGAPIIMQSKS
jgi:hypothetical protein